MKISRWRCATPRSRAGSNPPPIGLENLASTRPTSANSTPTAQRPLLLGCSVQSTLGSSRRVEESLHLGEAAHLLVQEGHQRRGADVERAVHVATQRDERIGLLDQRRPGLGTSVRAITSAATAIGGDLRSGKWR